MKHLTVEGTARGEVLDRDVHFGWGTLGRLGDRGDRAREATCRRVCSVRSAGHMQGADGFACVCGACRGASLRRQ